MAQPNKGSGAVIVSKDLDAGRDPGGHIREHDTALKYKLSAQNTARGRTLKKVERLEMEGIRFD